MHRGSRQANQMRIRLHIGWMLLAAFGLGSGTAQPAVYLNEILFDPPGADSPNEYVELRGTPNFTLPAGTYFVAVEGDASGNPGAIQNYFDLSGRTIGGNGEIGRAAQFDVYVGRIR